MEENVTIVFYGDSGSKKTARYSGGILTVDFNTWGNNRNTRSADSQIWTATRSVVFIPVALNDILLRAQLSQFLEKMF